MSIQLVAEAQTLEDVIVEEYFVSDTATSYRVYLDMGEGDKLLSVFGYSSENGIPGNELNFQTSTEFEQDFLGEDFGEDVNAVLFLSFPDLALDSYLSFGACAANFAGVPEELDNDDSDLIGFKNPDGFIEAEVVETSTLGIPFINNEVFSNLSTGNGAYYFPGGTSGFTDENIILVGQFTTSGDFEFELNVQLQNDGEEQIFVHTNEMLPDGSMAVVDDRLKFSSQTIECAQPFPSVDESSLNSSFTGNSILTQWQSVPGQIGCQLAVRFAGGPLLGTRIVGGANASSFNIPGSVLQPGTDYEWCVRCGCSQNPLIAGPFTSWQPFSTPGGAELTTLSNTATDISSVSFTVTDGGRADLEVFDITGKKLASLFSGDAESELDYTFNYNISNLPNGVYIYRLTTDAEVKTEKFMIAR